MPEEIKDNEELALDNEGADVNADADNRDGTADDGDPVEKYETLQKSYDGLQRKLSEQGNELGVLRKKVKDVDQTDKLAAVLEQIAAPKKDKPPIDWEALTDKLGTEIVDNPKKGVQELLNVVNTWMTEDRQRVESLADEKVGKIEKELLSLRDSLLTMDDDYKQYEPIIKKLRDNGMSLSEAKKVAKSLSDVIPAKGERQVVSTGVTPSRQVTAPTGKSKSVVSDDEWERLKTQNGLSDSDRADFEKMMGRK